MKTATQYLLPLATLLLAWSAPSLHAADDGLPAWAQATTLPDNSESARQAAVARLRSAPARPVCGDKSAASRPYGSTCASREYAAPPILEAPSIRWQMDYGWWAVWSPFLIDGKVLTGSCNNDTNRGLSALDMANGKVLWRIGDVCAQGNRAGSMGRARFYELDARSVLFTLSRDDGKPDDYYVVDIKAGKILRTLTPAKRGPWTWQDGMFTVITHSTPDQETYLNGLDANLSKVVWRDSSFRFKCDKLDPHCEPVFSPSAGSDGILYLSATAKDQPDPPTRQLHAFDARSGKLLWRHTAQPPFSPLYKPGYRSDDGAPLVAGGKVIIRLGSYLDAGRGERAMSLRALDARSGAIAWTSEPVPLGQGFQKGLTLGNRIAVGDMLVAQFQGASGTQLFGYRLSDGRLMWHRPANLNSVLTASAGGAFYLAEQQREGNEETLLLQGFDGQTGTLLWTARLPGHNLPFTGEWDMDAAPSILQQGPSWRIGRDGAIYGVSMKGAYKLR